MRRGVVVDRSAFDRIIQTGGYISERCGSALDANSVPISQTIVDKAMDAAACIGCGACAAFIGRMNREFTAASMKEMVGMTV